MIATKVREREKEREREMHSSLSLSLSLSHAQKMHSLRATKTVATGSVAPK